MTVWPSLSRLPRGLVGAKPGESFSMCLCESEQPYAGKALFLAPYGRILTPIGGGPWRSRPTEEGNPE